MKTVLQNISFKQVFFSRKTFIVLEMVRRGSDRPLFQQEFSNPIPKGQEIARELSLGFANYC